MNLFITVKLKQILKISIFFTTLCILLFLSESNFNSVSTSIDIFEKQVLPSLFPFILFTEIILNTEIINTVCRHLGKSISTLFRIPCNAYIAVITGFLCGFPMGATAINNLYKQGKISKKIANYLLKFTNNCNPAFIISTIGIGLFNNVKIGFLILISHYLSSIIIGIMSNNIDDNLIIHENRNNLKFLNKKNTKLEKKYRILKEEEKTFYKENYDKKVINNKENTNFMEIIKSSIINTLKSLSLIFGFLVIFNLIFNTLDFFLAQLGVDFKIRCLISAILEMTSGSRNIFLSDYSYIMKVCLISFTLGFSGFSIIAQIHSSISQFNFSIFYIIKFKLLQGILSFLISYILLNIKSIIRLNYFNILLIIALLFLIYLLFSNIFFKGNQKNSSLKN